MENKQGELELEEITDSTLSLPQIPPTKSSNTPEIQDLTLTPPRSRNSEKSQVKAATRKKHESENGLTHQLERKNGFIKIHSLSSNVQIVIPETSRNREDAEHFPVLHDNYVRPRTAFNSPMVRNSRICSTATSVTSFMSEGSFACNREDPALAIHPNDDFNSNPGCIEWVPDTPNSSSSISSVVLAQTHVDVADKEERKLRQRFELKIPEQDSYNEWRVGMRDATEESINLREISELLYSKELGYDGAGDGASYAYRLHYGRIPEYITKFCKLPAPPGFQIKSQLIRSKKGLDGKLYPTYFMNVELTRSNFIKQMLVLTARRSNLFKTDYVISVSPSNLSPKSEYCVGILRGNISGSDYTLKISNDFDFAREVNVDSSDDNILLRDWEQFLSIRFEPSALGIKGPRRQRITIPLLKCGWQQCRPVGDFESYAASKFIIDIANRPPRWSQDTGTYVLNFSSRVKKSSVKNFQLAFQETGFDITLLQFGRTDNPNKFILDFGYPLCPLQAFAIALASFDSKWGID